MPSCLCSAQWRRAREFEEMSKQRKRIREGPGFDRRVKAAKARRREWNKKVRRVERNKPSTQRFGTRDCMATRFGVEGPGGKRRNRESAHAKGKHSFTVLITIIIAFHCEISVKSVKSLKWCGSSSGRKWPENCQKRHLFGLIPQEKVRAA